MGIDLAANDTTKVMRLLGLVVGWMQLGRIGRTASAYQIRKKYRKLLLWDDVDGSSSFSCFQPNLTL